jgi:uncharacterized protein YegL
MYEVEMLLHTATDAFLPSTGWDPSYSFGIVRIRTVQTQITDSPIALFFSVDDSGSMSDTCADGRTKMQHIKHTLCNILYLLAEEEANHGLVISVAMESFDSTVKPLFDFVEVNAANIHSLTQQIDTLRPRNMTNIEGALESASKKIAAFRSTHPEVRPIHIHLTDGQTNVGETRPQQLKSLVCSEYTNIFIGFGNEHDSLLLQTLESAGTQCEYRVVDKLENSGFVYGEIVHNMLYPAIVKPQLAAHFDSDIELYDYRTNEWVKHLDLPNFAGSGEKIFHFRADADTDAKNIEISFHGVILQNEYDELIEEELDILPDLIDITGSTPIRTACDLTKYMFRQRTQELLFEAKECNNRNDRKECEYVKRELQLLYKTMKEYTGNANLSDDISMREWMDDIYIVHNALGRSASITSARQVSQGRGDTYRVTTPHVLCRYPNRMLYVDDDDDDDAKEEYPFQNHHELDQTQNTATQPGIIKIMRECSV